MKRIALALVLLLAGPRFAAGYDMDDPDEAAEAADAADDAGIDPDNVADGHDVGTGSDGLLEPYKPNAYGPGKNADATGRPFRWETQDGQHDPLLKVKPNAYGPGIGMDQYGRPVRPKSEW